MADQEEEKPDKEKKNGGPFDPIPSDQLEDAPPGAGERYLTEADLTEFGQEGPPIVPPLTRYRPGRVPGREGVQYVVGTPPMMPVLRPLRQTLYDKMKLGPHRTQYMAFCDVQRFEDGEMKVGGADTNMTQNSQLGTPLEYDLILVALHPAGRGAAYKESWDLFVSDRNEFKWIFGQNTPWLRTAVAVMTERFPMTNVDQYSRMKDADFPEIIREISKEVPLPRSADMTTPDRKARRISSTEAFRAEILYPTGWPRQENFYLFCAMHGILYASL